MTFEIRKRVKASCVKAKHRCFGPFRPGPEIDPDTSCFEKTSLFAASAKLTLITPGNGFLSTCSQVLERIFLAAVSSERSQGMRPVFLEVERNAGSVAVRMAKPGRGV